MSPGRRAAAVFGAAALAFLILVSRRTGPAPSTPAPALILPDLKGHEVSLADFNGKVVLVDFWATWCEPCLVELPDLKRFYEDHKGRGFTLLAVSMDEEPRAVGPFVRENKIPYPVVLAGGEPPPGYDFPGIPSAFLIGRDGLVAKKYFGPKSYDVLAKDVEGLLK